MTASRPDPALVLDGPVVRLRALTPGDLPALGDAIRVPEVFAGGWGGGPAGLPAAGDWEAFARGYLPFEAGHPFAVCLRADGDRVVGTTSLSLFDVPNGSVHLGWTAYAPSTWGSAVNPAAKLLALGAAFDAGFERIQLQADVLNTRSRAAIERLGATPEGVLRHTQRRADGSWRDTAVYSVLRGEWGAVRAGLEERVAAAGSGAAGATVS